VRRYDRGGAAPRASVGPRARHPRRQPLEADELARHAERLGVGAAGGDQVAGAGGVAGGGAVEEHRGPGAARAHDRWARAEALVHRERVGEVALGVVPAPEAGGEHPADLALGPLAGDGHNEYLRLVGDGTHPLVEHRRRGSVLKITYRLAQGYHDTLP